MIHDTCIDLQWFNLWEKLSTISSIVESVLESYRSKVIFILNYMTVNTLSMLVDPTMIPKSHMDINYSQYQNRKQSNILNLKNQSGLN